MVFIMKSIKIPKSKAVAGMLAMVLLFGCQDFGSLNVDPNNPSQVRTELLLTNAQRNMSDKVGAVIGNIWVQYLAETQYDDDSQYATTTFDFNPWYTDPLMDLQTIITLNTMNQPETMYCPAAAITTRLRLPEY
jgi:hypothetical protein